MKKLKLVLTIVISLFCFVSCEESENIETLRDIKLDKTKLTLTAKDDKAVVKVLEGNGLYKVTTSNKKVAIVDVKQSKKNAKADIYISPLSAGEAVITVVDSRGKKKKITVFVKSRPITISKDKVEVNTGEETELIISAGSGKYKINIDNENAKAQIKEGKVIIKGIKEGVSKLVITDLETQNTAKLTVTIVSKHIKVTAICISKKATTIIEKGEEKLVPVIEPTNATNQNVTWKSSKPKIAKVDPNGKVIGLAVGTAEITVTTEDGKKTAKCKVTITAKEIKVKSISIKGSISITEGDKETLTPIIKPANATNQNVIWKSSKPTIVKVDADGKITAIAVGTAEITVTTKDGKKVAKCKVTVKSKVVKVKSITLNKQTVLIKKDGTETLIATVLPSNATNQNVTWESSKPTIVKVDASGKITAIAVGTAEIIAKSGDETVSCMVIVEAKEVPKLSFDKLGKDFSGNPTKEGLLKFVTGDTNKLNRTITIKGGVAPYILIQKDCSSYVNHESNPSNVNLNKTESIMCSEWDAAASVLKAGNITGNTITFDANNGKEGGETYIVKDAAGQTLEFSVEVVKALKADINEVNIVVGETLNKKSDGFSFEISINGYAEKFKIKDGYDTSAVEVILDNNDNSNSTYGLIVKGLAPILYTDVVLTDGVHEETITIIVKEPEPMKIRRKTTELNSTTEYGFGEFNIKGGAGDFTVTKNDPNNLILDIVQPIKDNSTKLYKFTLKKNKKVKGKEGVVEITVTNNTNGNSKTFKIKCEELLGIKQVSVNDKMLTVIEDSSIPYYAITSDGKYNFFNIKKDEVVVVTMPNGSYTYEKNSDWGSDKVSVEQNDNVFSITKVKDGTYYGDITITETTSGKTLVIGKATSDEF